MSVELWGFRGDFYLGFPLRPLGYGLLIFELLILGLLIYHRRSPHFRRREVRPSLRVTLLVILILASALASRSLLVSWDIAGGLSTPETLGPTPRVTLALLASLPWVLAGGLLGVPEAMAVGFVGGLAKAGWETTGLLTPFGVAVQAGLFAWLIRQNYIELPARIARQPIVAAILVGAAVGILRTLEVFAYSGGDLYDGLGFAFAQIGAHLGVEVLQAGIGGAVGQVLSRTEASGWFKPQSFISGPYNRSLAARMVSAFLLIGALAGGLILYVSWIQARTSARESVEDQMRQTAQQAAEAVPFFVQTGRSYSRQVASELGAAGGARLLDQEGLVERLRLVPFFNRLDIYGQNLQPIASTDPDLAGSGGGDLALEAALQTAMEGVPQEALLLPSAPDAATWLVFLAPVGMENDQPVRGVLAGWVDLAVNPALSPAVQSLTAWSQGTAFLTDDQGVILIHSDPGAISERFPLLEQESPEIYEDTAPDGTRRLVLAYPVPGYNWNAVLTAPMRIVDRLAMIAALRLFVVVAGVGAIVLVLAYGISRRLAQPLSQMAEAAESIARGDLNRSVPTAGEDEVGRLSASFEHMRLALQSRLTEMELLLSASQQLASNFHLSVALPPVLEGARQHLEADLVRLVMASGDGGTGELEVYAAGEDPGGLASLDAQLLALCRERGRILLENAARARAVLNVEGIREPLEVLLALPVRNEESYEGVLWVGHIAPRAITRLESGLLTILSSQLGVYVANARLYERVEEERRRLGAVLEATPDLVLMTDHRGQILLANPACEAILNVAPEAAVGRPAEACLKAPKLAALLRGGQDGLATTEVELSDGRVFFASAQDIRKVEVGVANRVCVLWDITHFKDLDRLKSDFVSTVSHDLKTPLTLTHGYAKMLNLVGDLDSQQKEYVGKILGSVRGMSELIDDLLDLGRIEAGIALNLEPLSLEEVVTEAIRSHRPQALNRQINLQVELEDEAEALLADATLLRQALANLLDNALKYTNPGGHVVLRAYQRDGKAVFEVQDNGPGVAPADQPRLFERFYRARRRESISAQGSGLGLSIVKSIAERHGGSVGLESQLGAGSTFTLEIPMQPETAGQP